MAGLATKTPTPQTPSVATLAGMSAADRQAALSQLSPDQAQAATAQLASYRAQANHAYLARSVRKHAIMPPSGGGSSANYVQGSQLIYEMPTASGGFAKELIFDIELTVTLAAGTGATYQLNAAAPYSVIQEIEVVFGSKSQSRFRPYFASKILPAMRGNARPLGGSAQVIAGQSVAAIQNIINPSMPVAVGANTWLLRIRVPLTGIHDLSPAGMLPIMASGGNAAKVKVRLPQLLGNDPLDNVVSALAGTGQAVTSVTGTIACTVEYLDGTNMQNVQPLALDLAGEPTCQFYRDLDVTALNAGTRPLKQRIDTLLPHYYVVACVVDGTAATKFCAESNILSMQLAVDSTLNNAFQHYGAGSDLNVAEFYERIRNTFHQDFDEGVIPWVYGPAENQYDPSNGEGQAVLNMAPGGGWTDVHHAYTFGTIAPITGITPRVETWLVSMNPQGLLLS